MEQGLGIGTGAPFFNRMEASATRFVKLLGGKGKRAPVVLVAHAKAGNALGDLPSYDAFLLGGPHSGEALLWGCAVLGLCWGGVGLRCAALGQLAACLAGGCRML